ncbi:hypothetical protein J3B02_006377, partial [Coemansia erecta]
SFLCDAVRRLNPARGAADPPSNDFREVLPLLLPRKPVGPEVLAIVRGILEGERASTDDTLLLIDLSVGDETAELNAVRLITGDFGDDNSALNDELRCFDDEPKEFNDDRALED